MIVNHSGVHSEKRSLHHLRLHAVILERFVGQITIPQKGSRMQQIIANQEREVDR